MGVELPADSTKHADDSDASLKDIDLKEQPGFAGTAHALLQGGVPSVIAMRYAVGDEYARELTIEFYRALLTHAQPKTVAAALTMSRQSLLDELGAELIGSRKGNETQPVAVVTGLGGMGKTALVAESLALWETRFDWVLLYQAKPNAF